MKKTFVLFLIAFLLITHFVSAQTNTNTMFTYKVGKFEITVLPEVQQSVGSNILINATPEMIKECSVDGTFPNAVNAFLIRTPEKNILMDAGFGRKLFDNLQTLGIKPEQIDIILITHMHGDHIGGLLRDGESAFPNAKLYVAKPEYEYWSAKAHASTTDPRNTTAVNAVKAVDAYKKNLTLFEPGTVDNLSELLQGIYTIAAYGHTIGHTAYLIESNKEKMLIWGDLTHAMAIQMPYPQVAVTYDTNPEQAVASRQKILEYVSANNIPIAGMHIAFPAMGKIEKNAKGYLFIPMKIENN